MSSLTYRPSEYGPDCDYGPVAATDLDVDRFALEGYRKLYDEAYSAALATGSESDALRAASRLYRDALPPLLGLPSIGRFVAGVTQGMLLGVFTTDETSRLLFAAQVANSALRAAPKRYIPKTKSTSSRRF